MQKAAALYDFLKDMWVTASPEETLIFIADIKFLH